MTLDPDAADGGELERYELRERLPYRFQPNRRQAVQLLGAGMMLAVSVPVAAQQRRGGGGRGPQRAERLSERFHIGTDNIVTVLTSKVEVGQGSRTQLTQAAAEGLRLPPEQIRLVMADTELCPDDGGTAGSRTTPANVPRIRAAAVAARQALLELAAARWNVPPEQVRLADGQFVAHGDQRVTLGELASDADFAERWSREAGGGPDIAASEWTVLGTTLPNVKGRDSVTGAATFPSDVRRPGMLYGVVLRGPSLAARLQAIDLAPAEAMEGVTVVRDGDFVGCAATTSWRARQALDALAATARWEEPEQPSVATLFDDLKRTAEGGGGGRGGRDARGNPDSAFQQAAKRLEAEYTIAYIQHAPMEPRAAVAEWTDGKLTVWTGSQQPSRVRDQLAEAFRLRGDRVRVIVPDAGGGFGGKHSGEQAIEAARLAQAAGRPVSLRWTREEEFTWAYFRPAGVIEVRAGLNADGGLLTWDFTNYNSGGSALESSYLSEHSRARVQNSQSPLRQGSYRALASTANTFARECAIDELAGLAGADPLEFRLRHLPDGRQKDILSAVARKFDWHSKVRSQTDGRGVGIACGTEKGSYVASCAEVEERDGELRVLSVTTSYECGAIQNPGNLLNQVEGSLVMGLGGALFEEILYERGRILNGRFSEYRVPRISDVPELIVDLVNRPDLPSVGAGETPIIAIAPAIANAVFQASGERLRSLPMKLSGQRTAT
ncbi:MAG: xanthine dehydrogenase family protein molybdopterin-binding subunit [Planctomyces sp.]|nr:xanthine dehydrogenase family protein molybdopterin-binding subunit [Planctomyces sp.]